MSKCLDALEKINHTVCLNLNEKRLKFNLDKYEYCDCENLKEFVDCYCLIEKELEALEIIVNKKVNVFTLFQCCYDTGKYNAKCSKLQSMLTLDEVNLLKEVLK